MHNPTGLRTAATDAWVSHNSRSTTVVRHASRVPCLDELGCLRPTLSGRLLRVKECILFDHDGVLVDTEPWYFKAGERALADVGFVVDRAQYLRDMSEGRGTWAQAAAAGVDPQTIDRQREVRDTYYQEYLRTEAIEIDGVVEALAELSRHVRMAIVTTAKRADFELIHQERQITPYMDFVLVREDYDRAKPDPEPYRAGLQRFGVAKKRPSWSRTQLGD